MRRGEIAYFWDVRDACAREREIGWQNDESVHLSNTTWICFFVARVLTLPGVEGRKLCNRQSFSFSRRGHEIFSKRDTCRESHSRKIKLPSESTTVTRGEKRARGRRVGILMKKSIKKKMRKKKENKHNKKTIDSNSISIFFYQLYFSNYICMLTRKLIDQAMFRACGKTRGG